MVKGTSWHDRKRNPFRENSSYTLLGCFLSIMIFFIICRGRKVEDVSCWKLFYVRKDKNNFLANVDQQGRIRIWKVREDTFTLSWNGVAAFYLRRSRQVIELSMSFFFLLLLLGGRLLFHLLPSWSNIVFRCVLLTQPRAMSLLWVLLSSPLLLPCLFFSEHTYFICYIRSVSFPHPNQFAFD